MAELHPLFFVFVIRDKTSLPIILWAAKNPSYPEQYNFYYSCIHSLSIPAVIGWLVFIA